jgi:hypothetical protein
VRKPVPQRARLFAVERGASRRGELHWHVVLHDSHKAAAPRGRGLTERLERAAQLIDGGRIGEARIELAGSRDEPAGLVELVRLKLQVAAGEIEPATALSRVIGFLERFPQHPAGMSIYQELSLLQYQEGRSCPSFSHPPPARGR